MKKVVLGIVALSFIGLTSCKKCSECHYEVVDSAGAETEVELGEFCGDDLKALEADGYTVNNTVVEVHCHEH